MDTSVTSTIYQRCPDKGYDEYCLAASQLKKKDAVLSALNKLQVKIQMLEMERLSAERRLQQLSGTIPVGQEIVEEHHDRRDAIPSVSSASDILKTQLFMAETRCRLLEQQLKYMGDIVSSGPSWLMEENLRGVKTWKDSSDCDRVKREHSSNETSITARKHRMESGRKKQDRISSIDGKHKQAFGKNEDRKIQDSCAETRCPACAVKRGGSQKYSGNSDSTKTLQTKSVRFDDSHIPRASSQRAEKNTHYQVRLRDLPFVVGQSTSDSYSINANIQKVFSMMKSHSLKLCSDSRNEKPVGKISSSSRSIQNVVNTKDLNGLILNLQDEFASSTFEYEELAREINETDEPRLRQDLEQELDSLVHSMNIKSDQIDKLRSLKVDLQINGIASEKSEPQSGKNITSGQRKDPTRMKNSREMNLRVLKNMKDIQSSLKN